MDTLPPELKLSILETCTSELGSLIALSSTSRYLRALYAENEALLLNQALEATISQPQLNLLLRFVFTRPRAPQRYRSETMRRPAPFLPVETRKARTVLYVRRQAQSLQAFLLRDLAIADSMADKTPHQRAETMHAYSGEDGLLAIAAFLYDFRLNLNSDVDACQGTDYVEFDDEVVEFSRGIEAEFEEAGKHGPVEWRTMWRISDVFGELFDRAYDLASLRFCCTKHSSVPVFH